MYRAKLCKIPGVTTCTQNPPFQPNFGRSISCLCQELIFFCVWIFSPWSLSFIPSFLCSRRQFIFSAVQYSTGWKDHDRLMDSTVDGHLSFLPVSNSSSSSTVSHSVVSDSVQTPWTVAHQAPLSMGFSRQDYWSGLPFPSPGIFPTQGLNPGLLHCRQILYCLSYSKRPVSSTYK